MKTKEMFYSISKYSNIHRNSEGAYERDEWTSISDIGRIYNGQLFTFADYLKVEDRYVKAFNLLIEFFRSQEIVVVSVYKASKKKDILKYGDLKYCSVYNGITPGVSISSNEDMEILVRLALREHLSDIEIDLGPYKNGKVVFGFDYYMYIVSDSNVSQLIDKVLEIGLFTYSK